VEVTLADSLVFFQKLVDFGFPSADERSVELGGGGALLHGFGEGGGLAAIWDAIELVVEDLGALEHEPVKCALLPHLDLSLIRRALALVHPAHVATQPLPILKDNIALFTDVLFACIRRLLAA